MWNQIQADVYGRPVQTLRVGESTVLGAALLAGIGAGIFKNQEEGLAAMIEVTGELQPNMENHKVYQELYQAFRAAYEGLAQSGAYDKLAAIQAK